MTVTTFDNADNTDKGKENNNSLYTQRKSDISGSSQIHTFTSTNLVHVQLTERSNVGSSGQDKNPLVAASQRDEGPSLALWVLPG